MDVSTLLGDKSLDHDEGNGSTKTIGDELSFYHYQKKRLSILVWSTLFLPLSNKIGFDFGNIENCD